MSYLNKKLFVVYSFCIFLLMCKSADVSFLWHVSLSLIYFLAGVLSILMINKTHYGSKQKKLVAVWAVVQSYFILTEIGGVTFFAILNKFILFIIVSILIGFSFRLKYRLFENLSNLFACLLSISIVGWCLCLLGVKIPVGELYISDDNFHILRNYYFFVRSERVADQVASIIIPRFCSVFQEPGQLAVPCAFMLFIGNANMRDIRNWIYLIAIILSFSLSGYSLLFVGGLLLYVIPRFKQSLKAKLLIVVACIIGFTFISSLQESEDADNPFYSMIVARLTFDEEKGIVGNNRTSTYFDNRYEEYIKTSNVWTGLNIVDPTLSDWTNNTSGYKKYILFYGLIGLFLVSWFIYLMLRYNYSYQSFSYVILIITAFIPRSLILNPTWLIPIVLGVFLLGNKTQTFVSDTFRFK